MADRRTGWAQSIRLGLIGGLILLFVALVGMVDAFTKRVIIAGVIDLSQVTWFGIIFLTGMRAAARRVQDPSDGRGVLSPLVHGTLAGVVVGAMVCVIVAVGREFDLSWIFDKARPRLFDLLALDAWLEDVQGVDLRAWWAPAVLSLSVALGGLGAWLAVLPGRPRSGIQRGLFTVIVFGTMQDLFRRTDWISGNRLVRDGIYANLYDRNGLSPMGAAIVFVIVFTLALAWPRAKAALSGSFAAGGAFGAERGVFSPRLLGLAAVAIFLIWFPFGFGNLWADVFDTVGIYILMGLGLNIVVGFAGLLDLGYVAFFAIGAYTVGVFTSTDSDSEFLVGLGFWQALPLAILIGIAAGVILGVPVLKSHGDYLAIITLGFGEIIRILAISDLMKPVMGGAQGVTEIPKPYDLGTITLPFGGSVTPTSQQALYYLILALCAVAVYITWRLRDSRIGRAWMALREDEHVAEAMGINLVQTKLLAFATGAGFAATAGALFAVKLQSIFPASFGLLVSINVLVLIIVGGMASVPGVFVGALALVGLPELLREFEDFRLLLYGAVLVFMMLKRPEGLWPAAIVRRELGRDRPGEASP